jgi:hypothetical protein
MMPLWDEWGNDFQGVLTFEVEGAPRRFRVGHDRGTKGNVALLEPAECIHEDQVLEQFPKTHKESWGNPKTLGAKVWSVSDILERRDCKKAGLPMPTRRLRAQALVTKPKLHDLTSPFIFHNFQHYIY